MRKKLFNFFAEVFVLFRHAARLAGQAHRDHDSDKGQELRFH